LRNHKQERALKHLLNYERADGRPEVYVPGPHSMGGKYKCFACNQEGHVTRDHDADNIFLVAPLNAPNNAVGGMICKQHLPDDVVIYDPRTDMCRDKSGDNSWRE
jgi:hypothetical protein